MEITDLVIHITKIVGTIAFSVSGAMVAIERKLDLFGVLFLGAATALGGGILRDVLLGSFPPQAFYNYTYLIISVLSSCLLFGIVLIFRKQFSASFKTFQAINNVFDAIGLAAFSVVGVQIALSSQYFENGFFCVFLGMTTGVGGGILRDVISGEVPYVFRKHIYALASILGCILYLLLFRASLGKTLSTLVSMSVMIALRILATVLKWNLPKIELSKN